VHYAFGFCFWKNSKLDLSANADLNISYSKPEFRCPWTQGGTAWVTVPVTLPQDQDRHHASGWLL